MKMVKALEIINIFEIIIDYFKYMKKDLKLGSLILNLVIFPIILCLIFYLLITNIKQFLNILITITSIFIPLMLNILIIVHYSGERTKNTAENPKVKRLKLEFLKHINTNASMIILLSIVILILSIVLLSYIPKFKEENNFFQFQKEKLLSFIDFSNFKIKLLLLVILLVLLLTSFMFINIVIILLRIYRLINFEIENES